jgi:hypothetical protein
MNFFGTFAYGNIIKTFIPGFLLTIAIALFIDDYIYWRNGTFFIFNFSRSNPVLTIGFIIPISFFWGIFSNTICFTYVIPKIIETPFKIKNKEFIKYKKKIIACLLKHYESILEIPYELVVSYEKYFDVRSFLLNRENSDIVQYLKESYWYYMEFQLNSLISFGLLSLSGIINILLRYKTNTISGDLVFPFIVFIVTGYTIMFKLFIPAAKQNYKKHEEKTLSYLQGAYHVCRHGNPN